VLFELAVSSACGPGHIFFSMLSTMERDDFFRVQRSDGDGSIHNQSGKKGGKAKALPPIAENRAEHPSRRIQVRRVQGLCLHLSERLWRQQLHEVVAILKSAF
jgi:hypothetical protein